MGEVVTHTDTQAKASRHPDSGNVRTTVVTQRGEGHLRAGGLVVRIRVRLAQRARAQARLCWQRCWHAAALGCGTGAAAPQGPRETASAPLPERTDPPRRWPMGAPRHCESCPPAGACVRVCWGRAGGRQKSVRLDVFKAGPGRPPDRAHARALDGPASVRATPDGASLPEVRATSWSPRRPQGSSTSRRPTAGWRRPPAGTCSSAVCWA